MDLYAAGDGHLRPGAANDQGFVVALAMDRERDPDGSGGQYFLGPFHAVCFQGLFYAGATDTCNRYFSYYSRTRLLGEHVPYPVEAWPEGDQRHLSAESALYCRVVTEGLFGIDPLGLGKFSVMPRLPAGWTRCRWSICRLLGEIGVFERARAARRGDEIRQGCERCHLGWNPADHRESNQQYLYAKMALCCFLFGRVFWTVTGAGGQVWFFGYRYEPGIRLGKGAGLALQGEAG
jgi:hypothetical protein